MPAPTSEPVPSSVTAPSAFLSSVAIGPSTLAVVIGGLLTGLAAVSLAQKSGRVLGWFVAASIAASLLAATIEFFERRLGHHGAVAAATLLMTTAVVFLSILVVGELRQQLAHVQESVPQLTRRLEGSDRFGRLAREFHLTAKVGRQLRELPDHVAGGSPGQVARMAGTRGAAFLAGLVLTCFICAGGRRTFLGVMAWVPERSGRAVNRHSLTQLIERAHRRARRVMLFVAARAVVLGLMAALVFWRGAIPGPTLFAVMFGIATIVPGVGVWLAELASVGIVVGFTGGVTTWLCLVGLIWIVVVDRLLLRHSRAGGLIDLGPAIGSIAFFGGFELGGLGAAVCLLAIAVFGAALWSELNRLLSHHQAPVATERDQPIPAEGGVNASSTPPSLWAVRLRLFAWVVLAVTGVRAALALGRACHETAVLVAIALVAALAMERLIGPLTERMGGRRTAATTLVCLVAVATLSVVTVLLIPVVLDRARSFGTELPTLTERMTDLPVVGKALADADAPATVRRWLADLPQQLSADSTRVARAFWGATDGAIAVLLVAVYAVSMAVDGRRIVQSVRRVLPPRRRRTFDQSTRLVVEVVGRYFAGSLLVATLAGVMSLVVGLALGVALAPLAALWIASTNLIPQIGGALGGSVLVVLGFASSPRAGIGCLVYFLVYQQIENHVIQPAVIGRAVSMSPAATMLTALIGGSAIGVPGALIAVPVVGAAKTVLRQLAGEKAPLDTGGSKVPITFQLRRRLRLMLRRLSPRRSPSERSSP